LLSHIGSISISLFNQRADTFNLLELPAGAYQACKEKRMMRSAVHYQKNPSKEREGGG